MKAMDGILVNLVLEWTLSELWAISDLKIKDPSHFGDILIDVVDH